MMDFQPIRIGSLHAERTTGSTNRHGKESPTHFVILSPKQEKP
jgi:hypothetical protein